MSEHRGFDEDPDTQMSAYAFNDESDDDYVSDDDDDDDLRVIDEDKICEAFTRLVCTEALPPQIIEGPGFQNFMLTLNPHVKLGTVESLKRDCLKFYVKERAKIKQILKNLDGQISLSVEILRSNAHEYLCLSAHFIDNNWKQKKWVLRYHAIANYVLPELIQKALSGWDIEDKISTITLKSGSYNDETVEMVKDHILKKRNLQLSGRLFHVYCCADLFTLMVQDAFDEISTTIDRIRKLIIWGKSLPLWHITLSKLKEALDLHAKGEFSLKRKPSPNEWKQVEGICKLIDTIQNAAKLLFEPKYPTASIFLGNLRELRESLTREASILDTFINGVVEKMLQKLDKYWEDMFLALAVATVMDPRCKMKYIEFLSSKVDGSDDTSKVSIVLEAVYSLYDDYPSPSLDEDSVSSNSEEDDFDFEEEDFDSDKEDFPRKKRKEEKVAERVEEGCSSDPNNNSSHLEGYLQFVQSTSRPPKSELDWYLEEPVLPWDQDFDLLDWWRAASLKYPTLSRMARDLLSIPLSVVTSSNAYYTEERKVDHKLLLSGQAVLNALMCTQSWLREH